MSLRNRRRTADTTTTRWLGYLQTGDPPTVPFQGASGIGLMGETPPWDDDPEPETPWHDGDPGYPDETEQPGDEPPPDAEPLFADLDLPYPLYEATVQGWAHLGAVRCAGTAAVSATPIPCGAEYHDPAARSFRALYESAREAGWRPDVFGRWHCHPCVQTSGQFWAAWPARVWDAGAAVDALGGVTRHGTYQEVTR